MTVISVYLATQAEILNLKKKILKMCMIFEAKCKTSSHKFSIYASNTEE